jgi:hypothetical protein
VQQGQAAGSDKNCLAASLAPPQRKQGRRSSCHTIIHPMTKHLAFNSQRTQHTTHRLQKYLEYPTTTTNSDLCSARWQATTISTTAHPPPRPLALATLHHHLVSPPLGASQLQYPTPQVRWEGCFDDSQRIRRKAMLLLHFPLRNMAMGWTEYTPLLIEQLRHSNRLLYIL